MSKKLTKNTLLLSTVALSAFAASQVQADEYTEWTPRSVEDVKASIIVEDNKTTYSVQYGDTLGTIAQAMGIDVNVLANINKITNLDMIFPETVLTTTYNEANEVTSVAVETPVVSNSNETITATADLENNQVRVDDQVIDVADLTQNIVDTVAPEYSYAESSHPVEDAIAQAKDGQASEVVAETESANSKAVKTEEVAESTTDAAAEETVSQNEVAPEVAETQIPVAESAQETSTAEEVQVESTPVAEPTVESVTQTLVSAPKVAYAATEAPVAVAVNQVVETKPQAEVASATVTPAQDAQPVQETQNVVETQAEAAPVAEPAQASSVEYDNTGLQPQTAAFKEEVADAYGITEFSGYRPGDPQDHGKGLAVDFMVYEDQDLGDQVAQYAVDNMSESGISYIIWKQQFYSQWESVYGPGNTWNDMPDRGSVTENHYDHVHVSFNE
ncbi:LysM domain-containing protein [Streptococcus henryi]|uniref:LysM domain-containing protein n=1 Tax=Streptococcus henryi TaxID=439219 RepID=A0A1G6CU16_9STRE|nr:LysM domain-containing protein [Streptococcus henryi]SDB36376.1 LysM domain-containing protein [Streptococcus henryi]